MWNQAQEHEKNWWGNCSNTLGEELKQIIYAQKMGLKFHEANGVPFIIDLGGKSVIDVGGGPVSLLLKAINGECKVVDPCDYPYWVAARYTEAGIEYLKLKAEDLRRTGFDIALIYNVLQHTEDPQKVIENIKGAAKQIRIFEWIDSEINVMHPHMLTQAQLEEWLGGKGTVEEFTGINGLSGKGFYGTF